VCGQLQGWVEIDDGLAERCSDVKLGDIGGCSHGLEDAMSVNFEVVGGWIVVDGNDCAGLMERDLE
jgi:hypothetical protein